LRIWGVNLSFNGSMPAKADAPAAAAYLARLGINCIRVHHLDHRVPRGIVDATQPDSRHLDADRLDRLDFFIAELKKRGVYTNLNLNVARAFQPGDGVKDAADLGYAKALTLFDPRMIELEREYAKTLLTHRNPYTGAEYRNEPAIAIVECVNENSILESWVAGRLQGLAKPNARDATWSDIPASYAQDLTDRYHAWLKAKGKPAVARLAPKEFAQADAARFQDEAEFYMELEHDFFHGMLAYLKDTLKVHAPVVATSIHNGGMTPYAHLNATSQADVVDAHTYWQHPRYTNTPDGKRLWDIPNTAMVLDPAHSSIAALARAAVAGKPFTVSEINHPYPAEHAAEGIPIAAAYAALQDWDGIFWYSFEHNEAKDWTPDRMPNPFDIRSNPVKATQYATAAILFQRGDVAPARQTDVRSYTPEQVRESLRMNRKEAPYFAPGYPSWMPLVHGSRVGTLAGPATPAPRLAEQWPAVSDTGELRWDPKGLVAIDAPRAQGLIGYLKRNPGGVKHLAVESATEFAALLAVSLEAKPIAQASRLLLSVGTRTAATGMEWNEKRTTTVRVGTMPMTIEPFTGTLTLRALERVRRVSAQPLDGAGRALGAPVEAVRDGDAWRLKLGAVATPWYIVNIQR
jgi:hypothetical protein